MNDNMACSTSSISYDTHCVSPAVMNTPHGSSAAGVKLQEGSPLFPPAEPAKIQQSDNDSAELLHSLPSSPSPSPSLASKSIDTLLQPTTNRRPAPVPAPAHNAKESVDIPLSEVSGREKLKRHRTEVAGHVWIPDIWGQEDLLKDWTDCSAFDSSLVPKGIMSARAALIQEGVRTTSSGCVKS